MDDDAAKAAKRKEIEEKVAAMKLELKKQEVRGMARDCFPNFFFFLVLRTYP